MKKPSSGSYHDADGAGSLPLRRILAKLDQVKGSGAGYSARCAAHADRENSLSVGVGDDGRVLLNCFAGCSAEQIVGAVGLRLADLFEKQGGGLPPPSPGNGVEHSNTPPAGLKLEQYAEAKRLPVDKLREWGLSEIYYSNQWVVRIQYLTADGTEAAVQLRLALEKSADGDNRFKFRSGSKLCLYGLNRLHLARQAGSVVIVEGASDCHTLWHHGIPAVGLPGAGNWREERDARHLAGIDRVYVVVEPDCGGEAVKQWLAKSCIRDRVSLLDLTPFKDPSALHLDDPDQFKARWAAAIAAAVPWLDYEHEQRQGEAREAYQLARGLLNNPMLLDRVGAAMQALGYAGDTRPPLIGYVAMTSRLLERPQNLAFVAQSAAGKNRAVDAARELLPPEAVYVEKAGSARALIYSDEDYQHRMVEVSEADSIPEDGPAASAIRSLASDNEMRYDVPEKNPATNEFKTRRICKPGPTGLITTSTRSLGTQLGTRLLEVSVPDDPGQTRAVLHAHARAVMPATAPAFDPAPFVALQRWLDLAGERRVAVLYADVLVDLMPTTAVRMRRDFRQLLTCIQAIALLHQCQRRRTPEGWIEATIADYARARWLLAPIFDTIATEGVTAAIRATVEAVPEVDEVTEAVLAGQLGLAKGTMSWRVRRAVKAGWLVNNEMRRGHPARLTRGAPLPEAVSVLPDPEKVREVFECSNANRDESGGLAPSPHAAADPAGEEILEWTA